MPEHLLRILHISDLHEKASRERERWRRRTVLGEEWTRNLDALAEEGPIDLVAFTGDIADWGMQDEYDFAADFLRATLDRIQVPVERIFLVPGNHDINRKTEHDAWHAVRSAASRVESLALSRWIAGHDDALDLDSAFRLKILARGAAYRHFVAESLGRADLLPDRSPHGFLGYRAALRLPRHPFDIHIIGLDTGWLAGDDNDQGKLLLTEDQVGKLSTNISGESLPGFRLAMLHHPLSDLNSADCDSSQKLLGRNVDLVLRGHLHNEELSTTLTPDSAVRYLAAGCLYEGHHANHWRNACHLLEVAVDDLGRPLRFGLRFRSWSPRGQFWYDDSSIYRGAINGRLHWQHGNGALYHGHDRDDHKVLKSASSPMNASKQPSEVLGENPFQKAGALYPERTSYIRRTCDAQLMQALETQPLIVIRGEFGIGKSSLLTHTMARLQSSRLVFLQDLQSTPTYNVDRFHERFFANIRRTIPAVTDWTDLLQAVAHQPLTILLDEFGHLTKEVAQLFVPSLYHLATTNPRMMRVVVCAPMPMVDLLRDHFYFKNPKHWTDWYPIEVGHIDPDSVDMLLSQLPEIARSIAVARRDYIVQRCAGRPKPLQCLCFDLFDAAKRGANRTDLAAMIVEWQLV